MAITNAAKLAIGVLSTGGLIGAGVAGYSHFSNKESINFKSKLGVSVLSLTGDTNQTQWTARLKELNETTNLSSYLTYLKTNKTWTDLQTWCLNNSTNSFEKDKDSKYENFEKFCTWKVGDKAWTKKIDATTSETDNKWGAAHVALKAKESTLSEELKEIAKKTNSAGDNADKKAMHKWCTDNYKKTWTGDNDANLSAVKIHCQA